MAAKKESKKRETKVKVNKEEVALPKKKDALYLLFGLLSLSIAIITFVSLISYLITWADDQSLFSGHNLFSSMVESENNGGKLGLVLANFLITKLFGLGAFIVPFFFAGVALFCLKIRQIKIVKLFFVSIFGCIISSVAFSFIFSFTKFDSWFGSGAGGSYGYYVNEWLVNMVGSIGAGLIILIAVVALLIAIDSRVTDKINGCIERASNVKLRKQKSEEEASPAEISHNSASGSIEGVWNADHDTDEEQYTENDGSPADGNGVEREALAAENGADTSSLDEKQDGANIADEVEFGDITTPDAPVTKDSFVTEGHEEDICYTESEASAKTDSDDEYLKGMSEEQLRQLFDPRLDLSSYQAPSLDLLEDYRDKWFAVPQSELEKNKAQIVRTLSNYKIGVSKVNVRIGPTVTLYEIVPAPGVRVSSIKRLEEDIQLSLAARGVRVVSLPGTNAIGIEVANEKPSVVSMLSVLNDSKFKNANYALPIALGKTITGEVYSFDLAKMPHLLVAGATGTGKSVGLNAIITSLLYTKHPSEMKLVLVDPKKVELSLYSKLEKHFLAQLPDSDEAVITDTQKVVYTLKSLCKEMESRYDLLKVASVRNIKEYNEKFLQRRLNPLKGHRYLPYIVVVIDEFADLLMTAGRDIETPIARLAQLARAIGIHLVIATQRPTTTVITGNIKANFPARIAFMVRASIDSRTILDEVGANRLIGRGDMLISTGNEITRVQCALIETKEVERVVDFIGDQRGYSTPFYLPEYTGEEGEADSGGAVGVVDLAKRDAVFDEAAKLLVMHQQGSTTLIQRKMNVGFARAGRIMDQLEAAGIVGPNEGSKARQVLVQDFEELDNKLASIREIYGR